MMAFGRGCILARGVARRANSYGYSHSSRLAGQAHPRPRCSPYFGDSPLVPRTLVGVPASPGVVFGPVHLLRWEVPDVPHRIVPDEQIGAEIARLHAAIASAKERLREIRERAERHAGPEEAAIFDVQVSILDDETLMSSVESLIRQNLGAEKAFDLMMLESRQHFARHAQSMVRERVGDLTDVHIRVLSILLDLGDHDPVDVPKGTNAILVTYDLTPSLTVQLDREAIAGIATDAGTRTSHVAILARSLGIPAVVGLRDATLRLRTGEEAVLDGTAGVLALSLSDGDRAAYTARAAADAAELAALRLESPAEAITIDGHRIIIRANVDLPDEAVDAANSGADGVGLMRTEFLVVGRAAMPDEDEQVRAYTRVVKAFSGRPVIIRTYDIGGDKLPVGGFSSEANPFLGWRAIRMCLDQPELFLVQLRALLRTAVHGDVRILLPLVVSVDEIIQTKALLAQAADELRLRGVPFREDVPLGSMIETPAAAVGADLLASHVSFFSIGTNDLVQYTLAVDRGNANLADRYTPLHPAVLRLIHRTCEVGAARGVDVSVCGEMGSNPMMAVALIGLGIRQLSVSPIAVPMIKHVVRSIRLDDAARAADEARDAPSAAMAESIIRTMLQLAVGDAPFLRTGVGLTI